MGDEPSGNDYIASMLYGPMVELAHAVTSVACGISNRETDATMLRSEQARIFARIADLVRDEITAASIKTFDQ